MFRRGGHRGVGLYRRLMLEAGPYRRQIAGLLGLSMLSSAFALLTPLPLKIAVDSVVGAHPLPGFIAPFVPAGMRQSQTGVLIVAAGLLVVIFLFKQLQEFASLTLSTYTGEKLLLEFRSRLFRHAERLSLGYHDSVGTADSTYRIQYDATAIQNVAVTALIPFVTAVVTVAGMIYVTARIDWQLALISMAVAPILFLVMRAYRKRLRAQWHEAKRLDSAALSVVQESLEGLRVVKAFGREDHARDRFADRSGASMRAKVGLAYVEGRFGVLIGATIGLGMGTILFLGTRRVLTGAITLGELVLVMGYLEQLYDPLKTASKKVGSLQSSLASAERVYSLLDRAPDFTDPPDAKPLIRATGAVSFRNVSFSYESGQGVLHDVSFAVAPGARLGIAGATGAGKTTLVSLLTRFYDPTSGEILLDGTDVRQYRLADLRSQFAIVLQEPVLFSTSVAENLAYARPGAREAELVAAAKAASAHDFISALPDGYNTPVGERGLRLSGGERQRIALARAFLKDAPILILDEPTSSVDAGTEADILGAMEQLMSGRTTFMIAHRTSTLGICDSRVELEHGRVLGKRPARARGMRPARRHAADASASRGRGRRRRVPVPCDPVDHAAVRAWRTIAPAGAQVERIDRLRAKEKGEIYRLVADAEVGSVIAKLRRRDVLLVEQTIYEHVLPLLPGAALRYFGSVPHEDENFAWLFLEDAGDEPCSLREHGSLAARWLGTMHGAAHELDSVRSLPKRGPDHYLEHLRAGRGTIIDSFANPSLSRDKPMLRALISSCDLIESNWSLVEEKCNDLPRTLVHGDLASRNLRLRRGKPGPSIVAFDWEWSGFGVPAVDVLKLAANATREDLRSYHERLGQFGRGVDEDALRALVLVGEGFVLLAAVNWASTHLPYPEPESGVERLRQYMPPLRRWGERLATAAWDRR